MTAATINDVRRLAALARISIPEETLAEFSGDFEAVLSYISKLDELTLPLGEARVLPTMRNVLRPDENPHARGAFTEKVVAQFPEKEGNLLSVKKILHHD